MEEKKSKLERIFEEAKSDFNLTILNIAEKSREIPALKNKWCYKIVIEEKLLKKMEETLSEMIEMFVSASKSSHSRLKANDQEDIVALRNKVKAQKDVIRFLQLLLDNQIKTFTWDIKNAIEQQKLENM